MTGSRDSDVLRRLDAVEKEQLATRKWRTGIDALVNKGKGFWFAVILIGSTAAAGIATLWEVLRRGVAGS